MIKDLPFFYDEPFADSSAIPTTLVSKAARKDVTVALSADGGDEIFGGYNRYDFMHRYGKTLNSIPKAVRNILVGAMGNISSEKIPVHQHSNVHTGISCSVFSTSGTGRVCSWHVRSSQRRI